MVNRTAGSQPSSSVVLGDSQHRPSVIHIGLQLPIIKGVQRRRWNFRKADWGHSRSLKRVPFESLGVVSSYAPSIVTTAVSFAVCEIFSMKEWCDHIESSFDHKITSSITIILQIEVCPRQPLETPIFKPRKKSKIWRTRMRSIKWCHFQWTWRNLTSIW